MSYVRPRRLCFQVYTFSARIFACCCLPILFQLVYANPHPAEAPAPVAQQNIYAPFSGAIYIIAADGQLLSGGHSICPADGQQICGNLAVWNWYGKHRTTVRSKLTRLNRCCPAGYTCAWLNGQRSTVGCCPDGSKCSGSPPAVTYTVPFERDPTTITVPLGRTVTKTEGTLVVVAATTSTRAAIYDGQYCSTMTAKGPDLPTTARGHCGTMLLVSESMASRNVPFKELQLFWGFMRRMQWARGRT